MRLVEQGLSQRGKTIMASNGWEKTLAFLKKFSKPDPFDKYYDEAGRRGVEALSQASPKETGRLASSWYYVVLKNGGNVTIEWHNNDIEDGYNIAILVQYGHGTGTGGYVYGNDFINPAMLDVFQRLADDLWKEVTSS